MKKLKENDEYTGEVDMAKTNMVTIMRSCVELAKLLKDGEDLPEWVQDKIAMAKQNMVTVADYMTTNHQMGRVYMQPQTSLAEEEVAEDVIAQRLRHQLELFKKGRKLSDGSLGGKKPADRSIQHKEKK